MQEELLKESSELLAQTRKALKDLIVVTDEACQMQEGPAQAEFFKDRVVTGMQALREPVDALEMIVNKEMCRCRLTGICCSKYKKLLFI